MRATVLQNERSATAPRGQAWQATILWLVIVALSLVTAWMITATIDRPMPDQWAFRGFEVVLAMSLGSVGALIATRRPANRFGWIVLALSVVAALQGIVDQYPVFAESYSPALPLAGQSRWVAAWIWTIPSVGFMTALPLLFPDGRLLSPRWRYAVLLALAAIVTQVGAIILASQPLGPVQPTPTVGPYFAAIGRPMAIGYVVQFGAICVALASAVIRYRRAVGDVRQQLKWTAYAGMFLIFTAPAGFSGNPIGAALLTANAFLASLAIAVAILRYRLYEIDVIINRTLVYGALSAVLAGVYTASITLSQRVFMAVTGERSDAAIVLTTLIVASTFTPLKTRLQSIVDARLKAARPVAASTEARLWASAGAAEVLVKLDQLRISGGLTQTEFDTKKADLLSRV